MILNIFLGFLCCVMAVIIHELSLIHISTQPTTAPSTTVRPTTIATQPTTSQPATTQPSTTQPVTEPSNRILIGDVDLNGTITVCDSTEVQRYIACISTLSDEALIAADVNKDSVISVKDATMIQAYIVKLIVEDSYCGTYTENVAPTQPTTNVTEPTTCLLYTSSVATSFAKPIS